MTEEQLDRFRARLARRDATARRRKRVMRAAVPVWLAATAGLAVGGGGLHDAALAAAAGLVIVVLLGWLVDRE